MQALRKLVKLPKYQGPPLDPPAYKRWAAPSCAYNNREYGPVDTIVIHATAGGTSSGAMSVSRECKASWHYLIPDEDEPAHGHHIWLCVPFSKKAWHVLRKVEFPDDGKNDINSRSIGIEIVNRQRGASDLFSDWQVRATAQAVNYIRYMNRNTAMYIATHAYLDPGRKLDPGDIFPWDTFLAHIIEDEAVQKETIFPWAGDAVLWAQENGIIVGKPDGTFGWNETLTLQRFLVILHRFYVLLKGDPE